MEMPKVTEHHRKLQAFVGDWVGDETIFPSPWGPHERKCTSRASYRLDLDNFFLVGDYIQESQGQVSFKGHGVYGWDPRQEQFTMHWFDTAGGDPGAPAMGTWESNSLCFEREHHMGHSRYTYDFNSSDAFTFTIEGSQDGTKWSKFMEGKFQRT